MIITSAGGESAPDSALQVLAEPLEAGASIGWGVFTTGAIINTRPALLALHLARLRRDAVSSRLITENSPLADSTTWIQNWSTALANLIADKGIERGLFRLTLSALGEGRWHLEGVPRATISAAASSLESAPIEAWISPYHIDARRPLSGIKSTSYAPWHLMALEARERGCGEAIYRDSSGALCEGARSNLLWRRGETLFTPALKTGCLPGIARALLISWLRESRSRWPVREVHEPIESLLSADEVMLTSSTLGPRAVSALKNDAGGGLWQGVEGQACQELRARWQSLLSET